MRNVPIATNEWPEHRKRILVVENDPELRYILSVIFEEEQYEYQMFNETLDLVLLAKQYEPDLILLDFRLPLINGGELCLQLKNECSTKDIPVIIYSAAPRAFISFKDYRQDAFLAKPFDLTELLDKMNSLIQVKVHQD